MRFFLYAFFLIGTTNMLCAGKVNPTGTSEALAQKSRNKFFPSLCCCCKPKPVLVAKEQTGWGYPKKLTHKGSLPTGWRRASSHSED